MSLVKLFAETEKQKKSRRKFVMFAYREKKNTPTLYNIQSYAIKQNQNNTKLNQTKPNRMVLRTQNVNALQKSGRWVKPTKKKEEKKSVYETKEDRS